MKKYLISVYLFCSLIIAGCSNENPVTNYEFTNHSFDRNAIVGVVTFKYLQEDLYNDDLCDNSYHIIAYFDKLDRQTFNDENTITVNTNQLRKDENNFYQSSIIYQGKNQKYDVYLGYDKTNTVEKEASDLYPAFSHEVGFDKPVKLLNFVPNQLIDRNNDLQLSWEQSKNEFTDYKVEIYSFDYYEGDNYIRNIDNYKYYNLGNVNSVVIPKKVLKNCEGRINHLIITKREAVLVPIEVNRDKFKEDKEYKVLYIARSTYKTSFVLKKP